ncbi:MAG TPA: DUF6691 family protein [Acidiferrobacterales bacterium]|nr:DUF6691 family protein [Acidiferrobacterales bacterium]
MTLRNFAALFAGLLFGVGLAMSQMINPGKVLAFLDVAGGWDPTLIFVMGGAVTVTLVAFRWVLHQPAPLLAGRFESPARAELDRPLIIGAAIFGVGWGFAGYCPGPAIGALSLGTAGPWMFVGAMAIGSLSYHWLSSVHTTGSLKTNL